MKIGKSIAAIDRHIINPGLIAILVVQEQLCCSSELLFLYSYDLITLHKLCVDSLYLCFVVSFTFQSLFFLRIITVFRWVGDETWLFTETPTHSWTFKHIWLITVQMRCLRRSICNYPSTVIHEEIYLPLTVSIWFNVICIRFWL